jgi:hypothetical protein
MPGDARFNHVFKDKRFKPIKKNQTKVKIDSRFKDALETQEFTRKRKTFDLEGFY